MSASESPSSPDWPALVAACDDALLRDRPAVQRLLRDARTRASRGQPYDKLLAQGLERLEASRALAAERLRRHPALGERPTLAFRDPLPICERIDEIAAAIRDHQVVVVAGETGSGKSTQLPKICLQLGRGVHGIIGHTQPRRLAARSIAARIAEDLESRVGDAVGFKIRFTDAISPHTVVKVMTDGVLLAELRSDRQLAQYDTLIIDEAHERSLNIDLLLGVLHRLLPHRPELRVIVTSATIDAARFAEFFAGAVAPGLSTNVAVASVSDLQPALTACAESRVPDGLPIAPETSPVVPVIEVSGRVYPVEVRYRPWDEDDADADPCAAIADAVDELLRETSGDILVFLPTERDIREAAEVLRGRFPGSGRRKPGGGALGAGALEILPLYGRLSEADQHRVFDAHPGRRVVLATNVAESSLTVPGIRSVVDTGTARISRFTPQSKVQRLPIEPVSRASADQRKGRCGRLGPGVCIRLYSEQDFLDRDAYTSPEILRTNLASAVLQTLSCGLGDLESLPLIDRPQPGAIRGGTRTLSELGAIQETPGGRTLTEIGRKLALLPVDPQVGRMILAAEAEHVLAEVLIIAAALEIRDPRDRPIDRQQAADEVHRQFIVEGSDFLTLLQIWDVFQGWTERLSNSQVRKACQQNFLSYMRMREWRDLHRQLCELVQRTKVRIGPRHGDVDAVHRALLTGLLSQVAMRTETGEYLGAGQQTLALWPGSAAASKKPRWIMAAELVETSRRFARTAAGINPDGIERLAEHLVVRTWSEPHWDRKAASVMAFERVTLFGLPIVPRRRGAFGPVDPEQARKLFIEHALVAGDFDSRAPFHRHNRQLKEDLKDWQAKLRKSQLFASEDKQFEFFDARLPATVCDGRSLDRWRKLAEAQQPELLFLRPEDLLADPDQSLDAGQFPNELNCGGRMVRVEYRLEPGEARDGLTLVIPQGEARELPRQALGWLVPGLLAEKVESLIKSLPKELRRSFVPISETARAVVGQLQFGAGDLTEQISLTLRKLTGVAIPAGAFDMSRLPAHLQFNVRIEDAAGKPVAEGRDVDRLQRELQSRAEQSFAELAARDDRWRQDGLTDWTFEDLPQSVPVGGGGRRAIPMLVDQHQAVGLRLTESRETADRETRRALRRLFWLAERPRLEEQVRWLPQIETLVAQGASLLGAVEALPAACRPAPAPAEPPPSASTTRAGGTGEAVRAPVAASSKAGALTASPPQSAKQRAAEFRRQLAVRLAERCTAVIRDLPRTASQFQQFKRRAIQQLGVANQELHELLAPLLARGREVQPLIASDAPPAQRFSQDDLRSQFAWLLAPGWLAETPWERLQHIPRCFEGMLLRWRKLTSGGLQRDRDLTTAIGLFWNKYREVVARRPQLAEPLEEFRWLLEEYRVQLFAATLRAGPPVSDARLRSAWEAAVSKFR